MNSHILNLFVLTSFLINIIKTEIYISKPYELKSKFDGNEKSNYTN